MRRTFLSLATTLLILIMGAIPGLAQDATPASGLADAGLPTLDITVTPTAYEGIPASLEAGRYLLTLTVAADVGEFGGGIEFAQPVGATAEEFAGFLAPSPEGEALEGTPEGPPDASAEGEEESEGPPDFFFDFVFAGGTSAMSGESAELVLDLTPGEWVASTGGDPDRHQPPVIFDVTGEMPAELPEPTADATVTMGEYTIEVTAGELVAGKQIVRIDNVDAQPHFIVWFMGPDSVTSDDIAAIFEADMTGTPAAVDFDPEEDLIPVISTATQSTGTSIWITVDLEPGNYGLVCFFPDRADGLPHAYHGMYTIVKVGG